MQQITIPNTQLKTSRIGFGTASLHHLTLSRERSVLLTKALDLGFTHFDTAPMYGEGMAERQLGRFLGTERNNVTIATKIGYPSISAFERFPLLLYAHRAIGKFGRKIFPRLWDYRPRNLTQESVEQILVRSLKALRTDWVDLLLVHEPQISDVDDLQALVGWLERQKSSGRVRYLGLAGNAINCLEVARQIPGLFEVFQLEDSLEKKEADVVIADGLPMQVTFGYMRNAALVKHSSIDAHSVFKAALVRNSEGMILASTGKLERLKKLATLAG